MEGGGSRSDNSVIKVVLATTVVIFAKLEVVITKVHEVCDAVLA